MGGSKLNAIVAANGAWGPVAVPATVANGPVTAKQTDVNGNSTEHGQVVSLASAGTDPALVIASVVQNTNGTVTVSGTAKPGSTVIIEDSLNQVVGTATTGANGQWTLTSAAPAKEGALDGTATDSSGYNRSATTNYDDSTGPSALTATVAVASNGDRTLSGTGEPGATVQLTLPGGSVVTANVAPNGTWGPVPVPAAITSGAVSAQQTDLNGNATMHGQVATISASSTGSTAPTGADATFTRAEDSLLVLFPSAFGFADADGHTMTGVRISQLPAVGTLFFDANDNGVFSPGETVAVNQTISMADLAAGRLKFIGAADANGTPYTTFAFQVIDSGPTTGGGNIDLSPNTITINLDPVYDAPRLTVPSSITTDQNTTVINGYAVVDPDNSSTKVVQFSINSSQGTLTVQTATGLTVTGNGTTSITLTGTVAVVNASLGAGITWQGDATQSAVFQSSVVDTNPPAAAPVVMDLNGDGHIGFMPVDHLVTGESLAAWVAPEDGVLFWDKLGDGQIHDASQWEFTNYGGATDLEGLALLADANLDGMLDQQDPIFAALAVWQDANANGAVNEGEVKSLGDLDIQSIQLASDGAESAPAPGVKVYGETHAVLASGGHMVVLDASFDRVL